MLYKHIITVHLLQNVIVVIVSQLPATLVMTESVSVVTVCPAIGVLAVNHVPPDISEDLRFRVMKVVRTTCT